MARPVTCIRVFTNQTPDQRPREVLAREAPSTFNQKDTHAEEIETAPRMKMAELRKSKSAASVTLKAVRRLATRQSCQRAIKEFMSFCRARSLPLLADETIYAALVSIANTKYLHDAQHHLGLKLPPACMDTCPQFSWFGPRHLLRFHSALRRWRRLTRATSR